MRFPTFLAFAVAALAATSDNGLNIRLSKQVVLAGQSTWLTCRVSPDSRNRKLLYGIAGMLASERQLDGKDAPITWGPTEFKHVPCDAGPAYCVVERQGERPLQAMLELQVAGCEPQ